MKVAILSKQHPWLCSDTIAVVGNASFPDFDLDAYDIGGELIWDAPKPDLSFVTHYMVYMARIPTRSQETRRFEASNEHGCESAALLAYSAVEHLGCVCAMDPGTSPFCPIVPGSSLELFETRAH
ncbi:unnamed protein product [Cladocopium goreaui]|uniref:GPS domain-containing protein n=1 Tax=Cladocopium goreaui TaxID=2562237 RepID=A0A9P1CY67_9DINO|nr:unnamed protein product [Cladocopium goreaui]